MFAGHLGAALALGRVERRVNVGVLVAASLLMDIVLWLLVLVGWESVAIPKHIVAAAVAALALGWSASSQAGGGEVLDIELPSMRTPIESTGMFPERTRAEVREALKMARAQNLLTPTNEIGDTAEVLAQRETLYALQTEVMEADQRSASPAQAAVEGAEEVTLSELIETIEEAHAD